MINHRKSLYGAALAAALGLVAGNAFAQDTTPANPPADSMSQQRVKPEHKDMSHDRMMMRGNQSMHRMPATVTSVDKSTGMIEVTAEGHSLRLHFPPPSVKDLKDGDEITVHMGFTKGAAPKSASKSDM